MNNLKRVFSLALTGVMLSGMMVMGASATNFKDDEKIVNQEAVDANVALSIINGRDNGEFDPEGLVTRAEMAKMIATAVNGGVAPEFGVKATPSYTDIKGIWAEQYIEYCSDMKYIAGRGDGTFDPFGNVTGVEAAKMILTALGYDATAYQLVGADWTTNVNFQATRNCKPSLYEDLNKINMNAAITRDTAAQMIWNGLQNYIVEFTPDREVTGTGLSYSYTKSDTITLLNRAYDANISEATFDGNSKTDSTLSDGQLSMGWQVKSTDNQGNTVVTSVPKKITADLDIKYLGEEVKVIWKDEKNTPAGVDVKDTIYGVYPSGNTSVVNVAASDIKTVKNSAGAEDTNKIKLDGVEYTVATPSANADVVVVKNYDTAGQKTTAGGTTKADAQGKFKALNNDTGDAVKFILNANGEVLRAYVVEKKLGVITAKTKDKITIGGVGSLEIAKNDVYEGVAKDDIVAYSILYKSSIGTSGSYVIVEKPEKISGVVKGYKTTTKTESDGTTTTKYETVNLDGTTYDIYGQAAMLSNNMPSGKITAFAPSNIGEDVDLYLVNGFVAGAVQTSESATNYSVIINISTAGTTAGNDMNPLKVTLMAADGTKSTLVVSKKSDDTDSSGTVDTSDYAIGDIVTYTMVDGEAKLKMETDFSDNTHVATGNGNTKAYNKTEKTFGGAVTTADCVLVYANEQTPVATSSYKTMKVRDLGDVTPASDDKYSWVVKDGKVPFAFMATDTPNDVLKTSSADTMFGMVIAENGTIKVGDDYCNSYTVWTGEETTVNIINDDNATDDTLTKGTIYGFVASSDGKYDDNTGFVVLSTANLTASAINTLDGYTTASKAGGYVIAIKEYDAAEGLLSYYATDASGDPQTNTTLVKAVADDMKIVYVNAKDGKAGEADYGLNAYNSVDGYANAIMLLNNDGVVGAIVVETSNNADVFNV